MSVERITNRTLARVTAFRLAGDVISIPRRFLATGAGFVASLEATVFYLELDAARRYRSLTGVDLALACGEPNRYSGLRAGAAEQRDEAEAAWEGEGE